MIPKTEIIYSYPYTSILNRGLSEDRVVMIYKEVKNIGKNRFEPVHKKYINRILNLIPKFTGYKWQINYIPIYLVKMDGFSFSKPLTINIQENVLSLLTVLIHELVHVNFEPKIKEKKKEPNFVFCRFLDDMAVNLVVKEVVIELNLCICLQQIRRMENNLIKRMRKIIGNKKIKPLPINLTKETIKQSSLNKILFSDLIEK